MNIYQTWVWCSFIDFSSFVPENPSQKLLGLGKKGKEREKERHYPRYQFFRRKIMSKGPQMFLQYATSDFRKEQKFYFLSNKNLVASSIISKSVKINTL